MNKEDMAASQYWWHRQTASETLERISNGTAPWVAIGDFLDDWRSSAVADRFELVKAPVASAPTPELQKWAAFIAAMVEWLCWQDDLPFPEWTGQQDYILPEPWFLYNGRNLRAWQLIATPAPFKMRNIYGGDRMLDRV